MTCNCGQFIYIFKGDDTNWNNERFLNVTVTSDLDLTGMTAKFILGAFSQTFPLTTGQFEVNLSRAVTGAFANGPINGVIQILDEEQRIKTITNTIPFYVTNHVIDEQDVDYNCNVSPNSPIEINVNVGGGGGRAEWGFIGGDIQDQEDLQEALAAKVSKSGDTMTGPLSFGDFSISTDDGLAKIEGEQYGLRVDTTTGLGAALLTANGLGDVITSLNVQSTYSSTGMEPVNGTAVASAISGKQDTLTTAQQDAVDSGITSALVEQIGTNQSAISGINELIPDQATEENQLADKNFVNSSISTNTANFIGTFATVSDLEAYAGTVTNNDYAFVTNSVVTDNGNDWATLTDLNAYDKTLLTEFDYAWVVNGSKFDLYRFDIVNQTWGLRVQDTDKDKVTLNTAYNRYKATVSGNTTTWAYEYTLNNSSFTAAQWAAINSGITDTAVTQIGTNTQAISDEATARGNADIALQNQINGILPSQTGQSGKYLTTDGTSVSWGDVAGGGIEYESQQKGAIVLGGYDATTTSPRGGMGTILLGNGSSSRDNNASYAAVVVGYNARGGNGSVSIGRSANNSTYDKTFNVGIGFYAYASNYAVCVGPYTSAYNNAVAIGSGASTSNRTNANGDGAVAIGHTAVANGAGTIQIGTGTNSTTGTVQIGSYPLLDASGKIPSARLTLDSTLDTTSSNPVENQAVATALNSKLTYAMVIREW